MNKRIEEIQERARDYFYEYHEVDSEGNEAYSSTAQDDVEYLISIITSLQAEIKELKLDGIKVREERNAIKEESYMRLLEKDKYRAERDWYREAINKIIEEADDHRQEPWERLKQMERIAQSALKEE